MKYVKVMDDTKSNANGFEYKIGKINIANKWNPNEKDPKEMGGFNFSTEDKILRWLHRGNTIYDVEIPQDAEIIEVDSPNCPHGVFRTNKIIVNNPRKLTKDLILDLYKKSNLPEKTYYQCIVIFLYKRQKDISKYIIEDRIDKNNINAAIEEFENYIKGENKEFNYEELWFDAKEIYNILINIKNNYQIKINQK